MSKSKLIRLRQDAWHRYRLEWGNYKSDKHKTKRILRQEIDDLFRCAHYTKAELIELKNMMVERGRKNAGFEI